MRNRLFSMRKVILIAVIMAVLFGVSGCRDKLSDKMILTSVDLYMQRLQKRLGETDNDYIGLIAKLCSDFDYTVLESSLIRNEDESGTVTVLIYSYDTTKLFYKIKCKTVLQNFILYYEKVCAILSRFTMRKCAPALLHFSILKWAGPLKLTLIKITKVGDCYNSY